MQKTEQLMDREAALLQLGGDTALFDELIEVFLEEQAMYAEAILAAAAAHDLVALGREAHTIKSVLGTFCCEEGRVLAFEIEQLAKNADLALATQKIEPLLVIMSQLQQALSSKKSDIL